MPFQTQNIPQRITLSLASLIGSFKTHQPPLFELHLRMVQWIHMTLVRILTPLRFLTWTWNKKIKSSEIRSRSFRKKFTDLELFSRYGQTTPSRVQPPQPHTPSEYGSPGPHTPNIPSRSRRYGASPVSRGLYLGNSAVSHSNQANGSRSTSHTSTTFGRSSVYEPLLPYYINLYNLHTSQCHWISYSITPQQGSGLRNYLIWVSVRMCVMPSQRQCPRTTAWGCQAQENIMNKCQCFFYIAYFSLVLTFFIFCCPWLFRDGG